MFRGEHSISFDALPYIKKFAGKTFVIKYGGSIMKNESAIKAFYEDVSLMKLVGINIIIVHGGGPEISKWLERTGANTKFVNGLRVTDSNVMDIVEMVLSGHVNKNLAAGLSCHGISAVGISGRDSNLIRARKKFTYVDGEKKDIGFVGEVTSINKHLLQSILERGRVPVISPIGCDYEGNKYNINADYAASYISSELKAEKLIVLTDVEGVYKDFNDKSTLIPSLSPEEIKYYIEDGTITGGMIPKMECCMDAIENGTKNVHLLDGRRKHGLLLELVTSMGTKITDKRRFVKCQKAI
ncbi:MAG: acetylglutamate kinase [Solirubrobacterales bacterium]